VKQTAVVIVGVLLALVALTAAGLLGGVVGYVVGTTSGGAGVSERRISGEGSDKIAVVRIEGVIAREEGGDLPFFGGGASSRRIVDFLDRAQRDDAVKAVILDLDTPGGSVVASDEVYQKIQALRAARKVTVALMTETAASGGYYIAAGTDYIIADPTTITGSIGVIVALPNIQELSRKIGIHTIVFKSGAFKDLGNPNRPITPQEAAIFQGVVDEGYARFVEIVVKGRRMDRGKVLQLADGRIYTGQQAQRLGLVDSLGHFPEAVDAAKKRAGLREAQVVEYGSPGFLRSLLGSSGRRLRILAWGAGETFPAARESFSVQYLMVP